MYTEQCENNSPPPLSSPLKGEEFKEDCLTRKGEEIKELLILPSGGGDKKR